MVVSLAPELIHRGCGCLKLKNKDIHLFIIVDWQNDYESALDKELDVPDWNFSY